jgi:ABC-type xylose transport system permease subunit
VAGGGAGVAEPGEAKNLSPCNVGYLYDIKASALDVAISGAFTKAIAADPAIKIVAQGQSFFSPTDGLTAVQDMLAAKPDLSLIVGSDQGILGGEGAIWRTVVGVLFVALIGNGYDLLALNPLYEQITLGGILLIAVGADAWSRLRT